MRCIYTFLIVLVLTGTIIVSVLYNNNGYLKYHKYILLDKMSENTTSDIQLVEHATSNLQLAEVNSDWSKQNAISVSLSLQYMDQASWGARRLRSLQCWAAQLNRTMRVVEPSMNSSYFGAPLMIPANGINKFRDIFDIYVWNKYGEQEGFDPLLSWDEFITSASRKTILVQIIYETDKWCVDPSSQISNPNCTFHDMKQYWSDTLRKFSFSIIREVCINFRNVSILSKRDFNDHIFGNISRDSPVTIVFNEWRGPLREKHSVDNNCILRIRDPKCSPSGPTGLIHNITLIALRPTPEIFHLAEVYAKKYLNRNWKYLAIMVRWERMFLKKIYIGKQWSHGKECIKMIKKYVHRFHMNSTFLATDVGRYGSRTLQPNYTVGGKSYYESSRKLTEELLNALYGRPITLEQYDKQFEDIVDTSVHPMYHIPQLQRAIAAKADRLLLVGWGQFLEGTLDLYKILHDEKEQHYKQIQFC